MPLIPFSMQLNHTFWPRISLDLKPSSHVDIQLLLLPLHLSLPSTLPPSSFEKTSKAKALELDPRNALHQEIRQLLRGSLLCSLHLLDDCWMP